MLDIKKEAQRLSDEFLDDSKEYRLGFVEAEQSNPKTKEMGEIFRENTVAGVKTLLSVDEKLVPLFEKTLNSEEFDAFCKDVFECLNAGGKVIISGCGSTGRLAMRIEASFRQAIRALAEKNKKNIPSEDSVVALMTGGDYTIIRAVESFEDYTSLGCMQVKELALCNKDILVGVTATAETTSILGTAKQALEDGAKVWMIVCTDPSTVVGKLQRADVVYKNPNCESLYMKCGGMALTGSTRMQSSTIEQAIILSALELSLARFVPEDINIDKSKLAKGFASCINMLKSDVVIEHMVRATDMETALYERGGHVTYFADEYMLDVLSDTTERGPTFSVPPFRPQSRTDMPMSWAFAKNPTTSTENAWFECFERKPRCIDKTTDEYIDIGIKPEVAKKIPKIDFNSLLEYEIGCEPDPDREGGDSLAVWIDYDKSAPSSFGAAAARYKNSEQLVLCNGNSSLPETRLKIFEHLTMKMFINVFSTGAMAKMGKICGNYMICINIANKKLVDRATRIIADLCKLDYEKANYELFCEKLLMEKEGKQGSVVQSVLNRLLTV
ncbi:MAG: hypothetical protein E7441_07170 [Ruminococcaceae bacterium]|nr:hypothetical protein [Oscillospiraceae bacterium]